MYMCLGIKHHTGVYSQSLKNTPRGIPSQGPVPVIICLQLASAGEDPTGGRVEIYKNKASCLAFLRVSSSGLGGLSFQPSSGEQDGRIGPGRA